MPAPHPRMHGITHVTGGPDPVPGLLPPISNPLASLILNDPCLRGFWMLNEPGGTVAHDSSTNGYDLSPGSGLGPPVWNEPSGPPGEASAGFSHSGGGSSDPGMTLSTVPAMSGDLTAEVWVNRNDTSGGDIIGQGHPGPGAAGWQLYAQSASEGLTLRFQLIVGHSVGSDFGYIEADAPADTGAWYHVAATRASGVWTLYVDGVAQSTTISPTYDAVAGFYIGDDASAGFGGGALNANLSFAAIYHCALTAEQVAAHVTAATVDTPGGAGAPPGAGLVLGVDDNGTITWVKPPVPRVTVNGSPPVAASTPKPTPPAPPPPDTDPVTVLIIDQPFVHNGGTFTVAPKTWTTIPFTSQLMERMSDKTGVSAWAEIPVGDPDAAGWLHADSPHVIEIPHDMPFLAEATGQICLRIDNPIVQGATSHRALRILETTHQKTLLEVRSEQADGACAEGGMTDVFRGPGITVFASGDTGSTGGHSDIFFLPNFGLAFYPTGYDWLPYIAGVQSLRKGMRLVAQCWHDATVPLTFSCAPGTTYKPHFVVNVECDTAWGPPWSTWY